MASYALLVPNICHCPWPGEGAQSVCVELRQISFPRADVQTKFTAQGNQQDLIRIPETRLPSGADGKVLGMFQAPAHLK